MESVCVVAWGPKRRRAAPTAAITAVSFLLPSSIVIVWPALKPATVPTRIIFLPAAVAASVVVAPEVPTVAITAVSLAAPEPIIIL